MGDGYSLAWRILDAQYWGVPQRRKRIYLVADFRGQRAGEILFKCESVFGYFAPGGEARERTATDAEVGFGETGIGYWQAGIQCLRAEGENRPSRPSRVVIQPSAGFNGHKSITGSIQYSEETAPTLEANMPSNVIYPDIARTLTARNDSSPCVDRGQNFIVTAAAFMAGQGAKAGGLGYTEELSPTLKAEPSGSNQVPSIVTYDARGNGDGKTVNTITGDHNGRISDYTALVYTCRTDQTGSNGLGIGENISQTLDGSNGQAVAIDCRNHNVGGISGTLQAKSGGGHSLNFINPVGMFGFKSFGEYEETDKAKTLLSCDDNTTSDLISDNFIVRRLTPTECARLQGFPDDWCDGIPHSDSAEYKMWGNGIALPCAVYVLAGIAEELKSEAFYKSKVQEDG